MQYIAHFSLISRNHDAISTHKTVSHTCNMHAYATHRYICYMTLFMKDSLDKNRAHNEPASMIR
jgi:hypothetical protein